MPTLPCPGDEPHALDTPATEQADLAAFAALIRAGARGPMSWRDTPLTRRLGLALPIIQAPMAGGPTTPELVAAVCNAGGLGTLAFGYQSMEASEGAIARTKALTARPFGVNILLARDLPPDPARVARANALLAPMRARLGLPEPVLGGPIADDAAAQVELAIAHQVKALSFAFGLLDAPLVARLKQAGVVVMGTACSVLEAMSLEALGVDAVIAQGYEAGGHRGSFLEPGALVGTLALVPQVVDAVRVPVIAAGGIMDGRGLVAALALGASAAQLGTAFLATPEAGTSAAFRDRLAYATDESTTLTTTFTGKPVRALTNAFVEDLAPHAAELPPYPVQHALTRELRRKAAEVGEMAFMGMWAGQATRLVRRMPAGELVGAIAREADAVLGRLSG